MPDEKTKKCADCQLHKSLTEFYLRGPAYGQQHLSYCKACYKERRRWDRNSKQRDSWLRRFYGISLLEYDALLKRQQHRCAICRQESDKTLHVDHIHGTDPPVVRGLLCAKCNQAIGLLKDSVANLSNAIAYLCKGGQQ